MTKLKAMKLKRGDSVVYDPGYKQESGFITNVFTEGEEVRVFVCYDGTGRGNLTPYEKLRK